MDPVWGTNKLPAYTYSEKCNHFEHAEFSLVTRFNPVHCLLLVFPEACQTWSRSKYCSQLKGLVCFVLLPAIIFLRDLTLPDCANKTHIG